MAENCSQFPPSSEVYFKELTVQEKVLVGVSTLLCVGVLLLFADKVWFILRHYGNRGRPRLIKHKSLVLVGLYPVAAVTSLLAVFIPRSTLLCDFLASSYLAVCLYEFTSLIVLYFGGKSQLIHTAQATGFRLRTPPCCCCCCCCPTVKVTARNLTRLQMMVIQTAFIQPIVSFVSVVLWTDDKYNPNVTAPNSPATYLSAISTVSTLCAVYGLVILFRSTRRYLATHSVTPKFLVMQLVLLANNLQSAVLRLLADSGVPFCVGSLGSSVRADAIQHELVIAEMFLLAFFARLVYRKPVMQEMTQGNASPENDVNCNSYDDIDDDSFMSKGSTLNGTSYRALEDTVSYQSDENTMHPSHFSLSCDE
ncbi:organic solute transporter subunit alpha-like [Littorina saxatilis]|uniref:Organic solute transporter subunit alpha-like n=1 Tax=Littorina saxatilis TaxID=31220 RepID=A0AAN9B8U5_9CAEN